MSTAANRLVLISTLGWLSGCAGGHTSPPAPPSPPQTPPAPIPEAPPEPSAIAPTPAVPINMNPPAPATRRMPTFSSMGQRLNPEDGEGRRIYVTASGSCYVQLPFPAGAPVPPPGTPPPSQAVTCPPEIAGDAAWTACVGGTIHLPKEPDELGQCICFQTGNPPPPPRWIACPAHPKP